MSIGHSLGSIIAELGIAASTKIIMEIDMKKTINLLCAVTLCGGATVANAATYELNGTSATSLFGASIFSQTFTGTGIVDDTGEIFNSATFNYTYTNSDGSWGTGTMVFADASGTYTDARSCPSNMACALVVLDPELITASSFNFSNLSSLNWSTTFTASNPFPATTISNFAATPTVPVPAAAWLFGSALAGLIHVSKRRKL